MDRIVKLGLIGCGAIAKQYHIPSLRKTPGCKVVAVCDIIPERADAAGKILIKIIVFMRPKAY